MVGALQERSAGRGPGGGGNRPYIDLNPVRAGLCEDPKDYRYCDYAEAIAKNSATALEGFRTILNLPQNAKPDEVQREYRKFLYLKGAAGSEKNPPAFDFAKVQKVVEQEKGELSLGQRLRCKIRHLSDGVILGSRAFVEFHCQRLKQKLHFKRQSVPFLRDPGPSGAVGLSQAASPLLRLVERLPTGSSSPSQATARGPRFRAKPQASRLTEKRHQDCSVAIPKTSFAFLRAVAPLALPGHGGRVR